MISPWLNTQVSVQRRSSGIPRNPLNEPAYGKEATWTVVYNTIWVRIEYSPEATQYTQLGERVNAGSGTFMYFEPTYVIFPQDRITVVGSDDVSLVNKLYIVLAYFNEWDSLGNKHHSVVQIQTH